MEGKTRDGQKDPVVRPKDESSTTADRVLRGGSWADRAGSLHAALRLRRQAGRRSQYIGFRVCQSGPEP